MKIFNGRMITYVVCNHSTIKFFLYQCILIKLIFNFKVCLWFCARISGIINVKLFLNYIFEDYFLINSNN